LTKASKRGVFLRNASFDTAESFGEEAKNGIF